MSIYVTGDTHGKLDIYKLLKLEKKGILTKDDFVIVAGDFGFLWHTSPSLEEKEWLKKINDFCWTTLFVDGNHENYDRIEQLPVIEKFNGKVQIVRDSIFHLMRGEVYEIDGKTIFTMGGAFSTDREWRIESLSWWSQELPTKEEYENALTNLEKCNYEVDYVISHDMPRQIASTLGFHRECMENGYPENRVNIADVLSDIFSKVTYKHWYCGHYHINLDHDTFHILYNHVVDIENQNVICDGTPQYKKGEVVTFKEEQKDVTGIIIEVLRQGFDGVPCYDIQDTDANTLYQFIPEYLIAQD